MIKKSFSLCYYYLANFYFLLYNKKILKQYSNQTTTIVSVGNLSFGGSGKTPFVSLLSSVLNNNNISNSIISRGYKRLSKNLVVVSDGKKILGNIKNSGDEALLLAKKNKGNPVVVGDKVDCCRVVCDRFKTDVIIIDDGFQSHYINKNIEIVLVDVSVPSSEYKLFPLGKLREPLDNIDRADIVIFSKMNLNSNNNIINLCLSKINLNSQAVFYSNIESSLFLYKNKVLEPWNSLNFRDPVFCVSGIANNSSFLNTVKDLGLDVSDYLFFADHYNYKKSDFERIIKKMIYLGVKTIVTTLKDFVKLENSFSGYRLLVVDINHKIKEENLFVKCLLKKINK